MIKTLFFRWTSNNLKKKIKGIIFKACDTWLNLDCVYSIHSISFQLVNNQASWSQKGSKKKIVAKN